MHPSAKPWAHLRGAQSPCAEVLCDSLAVFTGRPAILILVFSYFPQEYHRFRVPKVSPDHIAIVSLLFLLCYIFISLKYCFVSTKAHGQTNSYCYLQPHAIYLVARPYLDFLVDQNSKLHCVPEPPNHTFNVVLTAIVVHWQTKLSSAPCIMI